MRKKIFITALVVSALSITMPFAVASGTKKKPAFLFKKDVVISTEVIDQKKDQDVVFESVDQTDSRNAATEEENADNVKKSEEKEKPISNKVMAKAPLKQMKTTVATKVTAKDNKTVTSTPSKSLVNKDKTTVDKEKPAVNKDKKLVNKEVPAVNKVQKPAPKAEKPVANKEAKPQKQEVKPAPNTPVIQGSVEAHPQISVDECVKMALDNNPSIKSAMSSTDIYKSKIAQAWAAYFPTLGMNAGYSKNDMLIANFSPPTQTYNMFQMPYLSADMLLFDFGKAKVNANMAKKTFEASKENLQSSINEVVYSVKESYYNLLFAIQQERVYIDTVADYELHLQQAKAYYRIGEKPKLDVITAEYNLGNARLNRIKAKNTVDMAYAQLNNSMGLPEFANYNITDKLDSKVYDVKFDDMIATAYQTRPEYLSAKKKKEGSELLVKASFRAYAPDVRAFGNYTLGGVNPGNDHGYQIGAQLTYKTTNLYLLRKQTEEAKATYKRDVADLEKVKQSVYLDVKQAFIQLHNAQESVPVSKMAMKNAKEQYDLASGRYKAGLGDAIELKDAETTYRNSQLNYYNTLLNYNISAANLERVIGVPIKASDSSKTL